MTMREMAPSGRSGALGLVLLGTGVVVGATGADFLHRYAVTLDPAASPAPALPATVKSGTTINAYNGAATVGKPNAMSMVLQLGLSALGFVGGAFLPWAPVKMFSYGVGFGALGHLGFQVVNAYIIEPIMAVGKSTVSARGTRYFAAENNALVLMDPSTNNGGMIAGLPAHQPSALAAHSPALPAAQPRDRMPPALASTLGQQPGAYAPPGPGFGLRGPTPGAPPGANPGGGGGGTGVDQGGGQPPGGGGQPQPPQPVPPQPVPQQPPQQCSCQQPQPTGNGNACKACGCGLRLGAPPQQPAATASRSTVWASLLAPNRSQTRARGFLRAA
jgi:hypothetical protein